MAGMELSNEKFAFYCAVVVVFVDLMGQHFTSAVLVPYTQDVGATVKEVSYFMSANMACRVLGNLFMPWFSDRTSRKFTMRLSTLGSCIAYLVAGMAIYMPSDNKGDFYTLLIGRILGGLFGGSLGLAIAYITELTMHDMTLLKTRISVVMATFSVAPIALAPIGGAVATLGLNLPFLVAGGIAFIGLMFSLKYMKDVAEVRELDRGPVAPDQLEPLTPQAGVEMKDPALIGADGEQASESEVDAESGHAAAMRAPDKADMETPTHDSGGGSPWCDCTIWMMGMGYYCMGLSMIMIMMYMPLMLEEDKFGLDGDYNSLARKEDVAMKVGLVGIPQGVFAFVFQTFVYLQLSRHGWTDQQCMLVASLLLAGSAAGMAFVDELWQV